MMKHRPMETMGASKGWPALLLGLCMLLLACSSYGQEKFDVQAILQETQKMSQSSDEMTMIWWIPEQFWLASLGANPGLTADKVEQFSKVLRPYTMVAVVDGHIGGFGGVTYQSEEYIRANVIVKDAKGVSYVPLGESSIDPDMKNLLQMFRPVIANMIGSLGQNLHFLLFESRDKNGRAVADPSVEGVFSVLVADKEFKYRLPLGSVLPPKYNRKTGEKFPGNYKFDPFTGNILTN